MNTLTLHPGSALAGAGVLALILLGTGIAAPQGGTQRMFIENVGDIDSSPNPRDMIALTEATPYVVPSGKLFVLTALNCGWQSGSTTLYVNDIEEVTAYSNAAASPAHSTMFYMPPSYVMSAGSTIRAESNDGLNLGSLAFGYLIDA